jgi:DNA-binding NarL/FixJ family response regulator
MNSAPSPSASIPRRELVTLLVYAQTGSHKGAAHRLGISESTSRQRISQLLARVGAHNATEAVWRLRRQLEAEQAKRRIDVRTRSERAFDPVLGRPNPRR